MAVALTFTLEMNFSGATWTDVTADVRINNNIIRRQGISGNRPQDRIASSGSLQFTLNNATTNSGGKLGYYSPGNANLRSGFGIGTGVRLKETGNGNTRYYQFYVANIQPEFGQYQSRGVSVNCTDYMEYLASHKLERVPVQLNQRTDQLITTIITNVGKTPLNTSLATGLDYFQYSLHAERDEKTTAMNALVKCLQSDMGYLFVKGGSGTASAETLTYQNRHNRIVSTASGTISNTMMDFEVGYSVEGVYNNVKATVYPVRVDGTATTILAASQQEFQIPAGGTVTTTLRYRDPSGAATRIAGIEMTDPLVSVTNYRISATSGGTASDLNTVMTIAEDFGGNAADIQIVSGTTVLAYCNKLELTGKGVYLYDPLEVVGTDSASLALYGDRPLVYDMPYQNNVSVAKDFADELIRRYADPFTDVKSIGFMANVSTTLMNAAFLDIGDKVAIVETVTGISGEFAINQVTHTIMPGGILRVEWVLEPTFDVGTTLILDDATKGLLDGTRTLGF
jgi:hypothetical protein